MPLTWVMLASGPIGQTDTTRSLYLIEHATSNQYRLVRLSFNNDDQLVKESLVSRDPRFFGHDIVNRNNPFAGSHQIVDDRFMTTPRGGVIDIQARKVIHDQEYGKVLGCEAGKLFYKVDNASKENGFFSFDLTTRKLEKLPEPALGHWKLPGAKSPDRTKSAIIGLDGIVRLHLLDGSVKELAKEYHVKYSDIASPFGIGPNCLWLDNERFLTQETNGKLVVLNVSGKAELLLNIRDAPDVSSPPQLWKDARKRLIYSCGHEYLIDIKEKTASRLKEYALEHDFQASATIDKEGRHSVFHEGKFIGRWIFSPFQIRSAPGLIAFTYVSPGEWPNLGSPEGVAVWSAKRGGWQTVKIGAQSLVGWAK